MASRMICQLTDTTGARPESKVRESFCCHMISHWFQVVSAVAHNVCFYMSLSIRLGTEIINIKKLAKSKKQKQNVKYHRVNFVFVEMMFSV